jgi:hypothetical protein
LIPKYNIDVKYIFAEYFIFMAIAYDDDIFKYFSTYEDEEEKDVDGTGKWCGYERYKNRGYTLQMVKDLEANGLLELFFDEEDGFDFRCLDSH